MKSYLCCSYFEIVEEKFINKLLQEHLKAPKCATPSVVGTWFKSLVGVLFPGFCDVEYKTGAELSESEAHLRGRMGRKLVRVLIATFQPPDFDKNSQKSTFDHW